MAPTMTEYERKRLENIKRNEEMLAALKVHSKLSQLSEATKRQRAQTKSFKQSPAKKQITGSPVGLRRSLRTRGVAPEPSTAGGLKDDYSETEKPMSQKTLQLAYEEGPISMRDAYRTDASDRKLLQTIFYCSRDSKVDENSDGPKVTCDLTKGKGENEGFGNSKAWRKVWGSIDVEAMKLVPVNIARVVPGMILNVRFLPTRDARIVVVGNKFGDVGFWNVDADDEETEGIYLYHPHPKPISGIVVNPFSLSKGYGGLNIWDARAGKVSCCWNLHHSRINTIDFNPHNKNIMATSSTDGTACIWDLRNIKAKGPATLKTINHERAVYSAYFSPSGRFLATTSADDIVGLLSGDNYENMAMVYHNNQTGRLISTFRGIWGWDDSHVFIGNMRRGVDIICTARKDVVATLQSKRMSAIPCRFDTHQYEVGTLASATSGGQVYIWKPC